MNLKKITILLLVAFLAQACNNSDRVPTEVSITSAEEEIVKNLIQGVFDDVWGGVDSTKISKYHTDDFIILEHGEIWDNERIKMFIRNQLRRNERPKRVNKMEYISIDKYGPSIQVAYHNYADFFMQDSLIAQAQWLESAVAVPTENGWRLKMMHSTRSKRK